MPLPEKRYFSLAEITARWGTDLHNLQYYLEHGELEAQAWLPEIVVKVYRRQKLENGKISPLPLGVDTYKGYAIVDPDELRDMFRINPYKINWFRDPRNEELIQVYDSRFEGIFSLEDLRIARDERNRFETLFNISLDNIQKKRIFPPQQLHAGRPSVMRDILRQFEMRCLNNEVLSSLNKESIFLEAWASTNLEAVQLPKSRTIMNNIRTKYHDYVKRQLRTNVEPKDNLQNV